MEEDNDNLMTAAEFDNRLKAWSESVRNMAAGKISAGTHGTGALAGRLRTFIGSDDPESRYVKFNFPRYGVFVAYGVGRGWIKKGDSVVRGSRIHKGTELYAQYLQKGYTSKQISKVALKRSGSDKTRKPLDWFDSVIIRKMEEVANIAQQYYGDKTMARVLDQINSMTIRKNYKK